MHIGLGSASFGTSIPEKAAHQIMNTFIDHDGVIIDTANNYAFWAGHGGESEIVIGSWLLTTPREKVEIHTKIGAQPTDGNNFETAEGLSKSAIEKAVKASLKRLQTDYIDVLYAHLDDTSTSLLETWTTLSTYVNDGTVKKLGISNFSAARAIELNEVIQLHNLSQISYAQYRHSIVAPIKDADLGVQVCFDSNLIKALKIINPNIKLVAYSPLLDGAFELGNSLPELYDSVRNQEVVKQVRLEARKLNVSPSALVLKKISDSGIMPLTMTGKVERLLGNLKLIREKSV